MDTFYRGWFVMKSKILIPVLLVLIAGSVFAVLFYRFQTRCTLYPVRLGYSEELNYLPVLAKYLGAFEENCIKLERYPYGTGKQSLKGLITGELDVCVVGLGPFAFEAQMNDSLRIIASIATFYDLYSIIARKDRGILEPADLLGHRIGTTRGSSIHYFLDHYLLENRIPEEKVDVVFRRAEELVELFIKGELDALCLRDPFIGQAKKALNGKIVHFSSSDLPSNTLNVVTSRQFIELHPGVVENFIKSLVKAEDEYLSKSSSYKDFLATLTSQQIDDWANPNTRLHVSLEQNLILELENISRWQIRNDLISSQIVPDYRQYIDATYLSRISPHAVTIIQ